MKCSYYATKKFEVFYSIFQASGALGALCEKVISYGRTCTRDHATINPYNEIAQEARGRMQREQTNIVAEVGVGMWELSSGFSMMPSPLNVVLYICPM